jgi:hypothetical protein
MNVAVVRKLVENHKLPAIQDAIVLFELDRSNPLNVEGTDDGEKLSHLLVGEFVLKKMGTGLSFNEAIREYSHRVRAMVKPKKI